VPRIRDNKATDNAVCRLIQVAFRFLSSKNTPVRFSSSAKNQSRVNPSHGKPGKLESLKARIQVTISGENRNK
jgi:hypothetical protein